MDVGTLNLRRGLCEFGHELTRCQKKDSHGKSFCGARRHELEGERKVPKLLREELQVVDLITRKGGLMTLTGTNEHQDYFHAKITLVCGHSFWYDRSTISPGMYHLPLLCDLHDDWKLIHQISSKFSGWPALIIFPREPQNERRVWKHVKHAGSGRA